jgi:hypothetical protein
MRFCWQKAVAIVAHSYEFHNPHFDDFVQRIAFGETEKRMEADLGTILIKNIRTA